MKSLKIIFNFYINSSIHVALSVVSLCLVTFLHFKIPVKKELLVFVFFGTVVGYNFVKYAGIAKLHYRSLARNLKNIQIFSFFSFFGLCVSAFYVDISVFVVSGVFGLFTLLYALPVFSKRRNLRSFSGIKIFIIAFVWAGVTVILPIIGSVQEIDFSVVVEFLQRFLLVLVLILPFEIRDLKYDVKQLGTIPQRVGITKTKFFGIALLALVFLLGFLKDRMDAASLVGLGLFCAVCAALVWRAKESQSFYYAAFWVEGAPVLWLILLLLSRNI